ncbi:MAG: hypothetical protein M0P11_05085 [Anaerolineaceae bacterium]|nr:hypothetical protein [Anaerolineaceae bacterium]
MHSHLTFFCELDGADLKKLFDNRFVYDDLKALGASVSMGILDFSDERVAVVRRFNQLGIPLKAWLLLSKDEGYWFNMENHAQALQRYADFKDWSDQHELRWSGIGLDIEPDINQMTDAYFLRTRALKKALQRYLSKNSLKQASLAYRKLAFTIKDDGYFLEAYHFPFIVDDRKAGSTVAQRLGGLVDVPVDREVLMLYSSLFQPLGNRILWSYAAEAQAIGIGSTGGGVVMDEAKLPKTLSWDEFATDLRLAWQSGKPVYVFSLEGCVEQDFLARLITFDWAGEVSLPQTGLVEKARTGLSGFLWLLERPLVMLAGMAGVVGAVIAIRSGKRQKKTPKK